MCDSVALTRVLRACALTQGRREDREAIGQPPGVAPKAPTTTTTSPSLKKFLYLCRMTPQEFRDACAAIVNVERYDEESGHYKMDQLMCRVLRELGYGEGVKIFKRVPKWYA